jgi:hypothetical protein
MISANAARYKRIRDELEEVRSAFLNLLNEIPDRDFNRALPGEAWTAKQEMMHVARLLSVLPRGIIQAQTGRKRSLLSHVPTFIRGWINGYIAILISSRGATRDSIAASYHKAHAALLQLLETLPEEAWIKGANYPSQFRTVEQTAHRPSEHFKMHADHIQHAFGIT